MSIDEGASLEPRLSISGEDDELYSFRKQWKNKRKRVAKPAPRPVNVNFGDALEPLTAHPTLLFRVDALLVLLGNLCSFGACVAMVSLHDDQNDGLRSEDELSWFLLLIAIISFFACITNVYDVVLTWRATTLPNELTWEFHYRAFIRTSLLLFVNSVLLFPLVVIFLLHSLGDNFSDSYERLDSEQQFIVAFHIGSFLGVLTVGCLTWFFIKQAVTFLDNEPTEYDGDTPPSYQLFSHAARLLSFLTIASSCIYAYSLLRIAIQAENTGAYICSAIYITAGAVNAVYCLTLLVYSRQSPLWLLKFRAVTLTHMFVTYCLFWITLVLEILVLYDNDSGFWSAVNSLSVSRTFLVYFEMAVFVYFLIVSLHRIYVHKFKKHDKLKKISEEEAVAMPAEDLPELSQNGIDGKPTANSPARGGGGGVAVSTLQSSSSSSSSAASHHTALGGAGAFVGNVMPSALLPRDVSVDEGEMKTTEAEERERLTPMKHTSSGLSGASVGTLSATSAHTHPHAVALVALSTGKSGEGDASPGLPSSASTPSGGNASGGSVAASSSGATLGLGLGLGLHPVASTNSATTSSPSVSSSSSSSPLLSSATSSSRLPSPMSAGASSGKK